MEKRDVEKTIDILILLSGPEPQRTILEEKLKNSFKDTERKVLIIRGVVEKEQKWETFGKLEMVNFMKSDELEQTLNKSEIVISRSGYTTIMDLTVLEKKAFFIPTPGQYEQEYLAKRLKNLGIVPSCKQEKFTVEKLDKVAVYKGLKTISPQSNTFPGLFSLFERK